MVNLTENDCQLDLEDGTLYTITLEKLTGQMLDQYYTSGDNKSSDYHTFNIYLTPHL